MQEHDGVSDAYVETTDTTHVSANMLPPQSVFSVFKLLSSPEFVVPK